VRGPGNLLGNLLCALTDLLNPGNPLGGVLARLRSILRLLALLRFLG
jgi:hypothetical protein